MVQHDGHEGRVALHHALLERGRGQEAQAEEKREKSSLPATTYGEVKVICFVVFEDPGPRSCVTGE